ncbi:hypothetical protein [Streptomyces canus]|uniref:hypothetical protein n=1 Tax=Streptomyces canus TaxID=58343 RepID=UPI002E2BC233|nr:hypothetical protein [Streptomyces canus]
MLKGVADHIEAMRSELTKAVERVDAYLATALPLEGRRRVRDVRRLGIVTVIDTEHRAVGCPRPGPRDGRATLWPVCRRRLLVGLAVERGLASPEPFAPRGGRAEGYTDRRLNPTATDRRTSSIASRSPTAVPRARAASSGSGSATSPWLTWMGQKRERWAL